LHNAQKTFFIACNQHRKYRLAGKTPSPTPSSFLCKKRKSSKQLNSYQLFNQCRQLKVFLVPSAAFGGGRNNVEEILWRSRGEAP